MTKTRCELCGGAAAVHCAADSAFLCLRCDGRVHGANFLASRHQRRRLAAEPAASSASSSSSSSSCVSSTADSAVECVSSKLRRKRGARAEAVLEGWARRMGVARRRAADAASALRSLGPGVAAKRVPLRVAMAAALWAEVSGRKQGGGGDDTLLCRLEAAAHVPARLVLTVASWMARTRARSAAAGEEEEGWAECSS